MTHTIHITAHQAATLCHVITQCLGMATRSPTISALLDIDSEDLVRINSILDTLPKPSKNGRYTAPLPRDMQHAYPIHRANNSSATVNAPNAAHGDH